MRLDRRDDLVRDRRALGRRAERAVLHAAPGPSGDLGDLGRGQPARTMAVELAQSGEGDMIDVHVQAHADRVGGDQEIDLPLLVQRHLGVAGARRQAAHHHGAAAFAAPDHFGERIDFGRAERDDGGARRQADQLGGPGIAQLRQPRAGFDLRLRAPVGGSAARSSRRRGTWSQPCRGRAAGGR